MAQTTLFSKSDIERRVAEMGAEITRDLAGSELIALCVLKGAMFFCSDLMRHIGFDVALDFIQVSSYGDQKTSSGVVTLLKEPQLDMHGKSVLIVEDIIDSGLSMNEVFRYIKLDRGAREVRTATFLDKPTARRIPFKADYVGFSIDPKFVIGYGLDYAEKYRNIPDIQVLSEE
ncbi:MAG: hypoxanthine phosphoribosyltransferase [Thermoanaerobaculia bacterium]|jgi:hypoxanthine phosphoribosyltransferase|nr:hypoxanthine phosphoribosyltransferase [Thermoanaerobaculia bacterium]MEA2415293.1 hypoxanthine phosphoribosyltransferase [Thermoanaerobaculia bacterium]